MAKDLAARVRNDGPKTLMIWADRFRDEADVEETARAVIIQKSVGNCAYITSMYEQFAAGVEIHLVTDEGDFIDEGPKLDVPDEPEPEPASDDPPAEPEADAVVDSEAESGPATAEADQPGQAPAA